MWHGKSDFDDEWNPLGQQLEGIVKARLDGVNISLDTLNPEHYNRLTGSCNAGKETF